MKETIAIAILLFSFATEAFGYQTEKVSDGTLVIVKTENKVGSFILRNQHTGPDKARYEWALYENRNNAIKKINSGTDETGDKRIWILPLTFADPIEFGPFKFYWSGNTTGRGFVYFDYYPSDAKLEYCVTWQNNIDDTHEALESCEFKIVQDDA
jgi:hypothetical protein